MDKMNDEHIVDVHLGEDVAIHQEVDQVYPQRLRTRSWMITGEDLKRSSKCPWQVCRYLPNEGQHPLSGCTRVVPASMQVPT